MTPDEIRAVADAVARRLAAAGPSATRKANGGSMGHEVPDIGWRMPLGGGAPGAPAVATASEGTSSAAAAPCAAGGARRIADFVDHTLLKAEATRAQIDTLCDEARRHRFAAVCVNGSWVARCAGALRDSPVKVASVVGFPLGAMASEAKAFETRRAVEEGADEVDMVAAIGAILDEDWDAVEADMAAVVDAAQGRAVKVILETGLLEPLAIIKASALAKVAGAAFVKTSTGFHAAGGATAEAVALMRMAVGSDMGVKASGGVRDCATALRMIAAGATRIGTSSGVQFVECLGGAAATLTDLLADPDRHEGSCLSGVWGD